MHARLCSAGSVRISCVNASLAPCLVRHGGDLRVMFVTPGVLLTQQLVMATRHVCGCVRV
jgi:hypothetical protein